MWINLSLVGQQVGTDLQTLERGRNWLLETLKGEQQQAQSKHGGTCLCGRCEQSVSGPNYAHLIMKQKVFEMWFFICKKCKFLWNFKDVKEHGQFGDWMQREREGLFNRYCVTLHVWTETKGQADAVSYESACSLSDCSTNKEIKSSSICCSRSLIMRNIPCFCACVRALKFRIRWSNIFLTLVKCQSFKSLSFPTLYSNNYINLTMWKCLVSLSSKTGVQYMSWVISLTRIMCLELLASWM